MRKKPLRGLRAGVLVKCSRYLQVNHVIHDTILASPLIQHKIDLFLAGLEYNAAAGVDLIESRKAYLQYTGSSLGSLRPIEEKVVDVAQAEPGYPSSTVGGVHAVFADSVRLFSLGSASRGIPHKEWEIPSPIDDPIGRYIYPRANLIAFVERQTNTCVHQSPEPQSRLIPMQQRLHTDRNSSTRLVRWWSPSCSPIPNNPIFEGRFPAILSPLHFNNGLQTCDACEFET